MVGPLHQQQCLYECTQCDYKNKNFFNFEYHLKSHSRNQRIKCSLCSFSSNFQGYTDRHLKFHHVNTPTSLQAKETDTAGTMKFMNFSDVVDKPANCDSKESLNTTSATTGLNLRKTPIELKCQKIEIEEADYRKRISLCKEEIRMARIIMTEMRFKLKNQREMRSEKEKQKDFLTRCLELMSINNKKLSKLSTECKKLEILRTQIRKSNKRKLESVLQLWTLQLNDLKSKMSLYERGLDEILVNESRNNQSSINSLKTRIKKLKTEMEMMRKEESTVENDVALLNQSLHVDVQVPEQVLQGFQLEIEELESGIKASLQDDTEDAFNQLIISTEKKINNLDELKNILFDTMFMKKSIQRLNAEFKSS